MNKKREMEKRVREVFQTAKSFWYVVLTEDRRREARELAPNLMRVIESGQAWVEGATVYGRNTDGVDFIVGDLYDFAGTEHYLSHNPTPETWR